MRFLAALGGAVVIAFLLFWIGAQLAGLVQTPHELPNDYTVGRKMMLCGRVIDTRHETLDFISRPWPSLAQFRALP